MSHVTFEEFERRAKDLFRSEATGYKNVDDDAVEKYLEHDHDAISSIKGGYNIYSNDVYRGNLSDEANLNAALSSAVYNMWMLF